MITYDRKLIDYLPNILKEIKEYQIIQNDSLQPEITLYWQAVNNALQDQFIASMTENGVKRWEKILNIIPKGNLTLDERKFTIYTKLNEQLPYTEETLNERLTNICGKNNYFLSINYDEYYIKVLLGLKARNNFNDVSELLKRIIPANMVIECNIKYHQHSYLSKFTHKELSKHTHDGLRYEGINGN